MRQTIVISLFLCAVMLLGACSSQESSSPSTSGSPSNPTPPAKAQEKQAEIPTESADPPVPARHMRVALGPLSTFTIDVPDGTVVTDDGGDAMIELPGTALMFHVGRSEGDDTRAHHEQRYAEAAPTLTVETAGDRDNGWVLVARRSPSGFDFKRYRSDLDLMCYQRMMPIPEAVNSAIIACDSIRVE